MMNEFEKEILEVMKRIDFSLARSNEIKLEALELQKEARNNVLSSLALQAATLAAVNNNSNYEQKN
jgi:hypothetical protein